MSRARNEVCEHHGATSSDNVDKIVFSCDGMWQKRGFTSLSGAVFIFAYETGKDVNYKVMSKHCAVLVAFFGRSKTSIEVYKEWKRFHVCDANFNDSAETMESGGAVSLFKRSMNFNT